MNPRAVKSPRITDLSEGALLRLLFHDHPLSFRNVQHLGLKPESPIRFSVRQPFIPALGTRPGDIDALGILDHRLGTAVAVESKRLKVKAETFLTGQVNKIQELKKGAAQANSLFAFGFARTLLLVMTEVDSSELTGVHESFRVPSPEIMTAITNALANLPLEDGIGVLSFIAVQNTKESFLNRGGFSPQLVLAPRDRRQPETLSTTVLEYFGVLSNRT